jgi:hypothetical protein
MSLFPEFNSCRQNSYLPLHKKEKKENPTTTHKRPKDSVKELLDKSNLPRKKKKKTQQQQKLPKDSVKSCLINQSSEEGKKTKTQQ